ncbi:MAG: aminotransferase class I/II-fold pyridoxal phosphate-dependent enzyme [Clostridiales Family XIII bacterium]|jgi:aminotransferase|nr:aminotransferase class I/II-fold pyridoxal phosphate-dependent enzyme [Clostridiales Family XIII bacterium]
MNPLFNEYVGAPWLEHVETEPSPYAKKRQPEIFKEQEAYPMSPGNELTYLDDSTPAGVEREQDIEMPNGLHMYHYVPKQRDPSERRAIYYIHGGGFMRGNGRWCRLNAITQVKNLGLPVYAVEYRYTPENKYPKGLDDATWGWDYLVNTRGLGPADIIVSGESAGGTYAMALCARLRRQGRPLPGGLVILSGYLDMTLTSPSYKANFGIDPVFTVDLSLFVPYYIDDLSKLKEPEVSPIYSDFTGYPKTFFCVDDTEVFLSDALIVCDKLARLGIECKAYVPHGLMHVFPFEMPDIPESQKAWLEVRNLFGLSLRAERGDVGHHLSSIALNYPASGIRKMFDLAFGYPDAIKLTVGEPNFDTPENIREACKRALDEGYTRYNPNQGLPELREAIAADCAARTGAALTADNVMVTVGAMEALTLALIATVNHGEEVLVPNPCFPNYLGQILVAGAVPVSVPVYESNHFNIRAEDIEHAVTPRTRALLLNSPSNPLGSVLTRKEIEAIAEVALRHDLIVFSDEVYDRILYDGAEYFSIAQIPEVRDHVLVINSFSKTYAMTGWRVGYAVGEKSVVTSMPRIQEGLVSCVPTFTQRAALEALTGPQDAVRAMLADYARRRDLMVDGLRAIPGITCQKPPGSFYAFPNISALGVSSQQFAEDLVTQAGVVVVPGSAFGSMGEGYLRVVFANTDENIAEAVRRIGDYVKSHF